MIFEFCVFLALAENSSKLENIWQISDCLSRKNSSDLAELLMPTHKSQNYKIWRFYAQMTKIYSYNARIVWFLDFCVFLALAENSSKLENIWQVSDGSSKKNSSDLAELLMLTHKSQNYKIWRIYAQMTKIYSYNARIVWFLDFCFFWL